MKNILIILIVLVAAQTGFGQNIDWDCLFSDNKTNGFWTLKSIVVSNDTTYSHKNEDIYTYGLMLDINSPNWGNGKDTIYVCAFQLDPIKKFASKPHGKFTIDKINNRVIFNDPIVHKENTNPTVWVTLNKGYAMNILKLDCKELILLQKSRIGKRILIFKK